MKVSKQINYSTNMCQICQGTTTVVETKKSLVLSFRQKSLREDLNCMVLCLSGIQSFGEDAM
jgi:hypothetical protein